MLELLVAVSLSTIVVSGLYGVFTIQSRQLMFQDSQMSMHQNLRFAADILSRTIRQAGYGTGGATQGLLGYDYGAASTSSAYALPAVISSDGGTGAPDAITLVYAEPSIEMNTMVTTVEPCTTSSLTFDMSARNYSSLIGNYSASEMVMCWDYAPSGGIKSYLWKITTAATHRQITPVNQRRARRFAGGRSGEQQTGETPRASHQSHRLPAASASTVRLMPEAHDS